MESTSVRFAAAVRTLGVEARRRGLAVPGFRSPPRLHGVDRSLRRRVDGGATVAVALRGRPRPARLADPGQGVVPPHRPTGSPPDQGPPPRWARRGGEDPAPLPGSPT